MKLKKENNRVNEDHCELAIVGQQTHRAHKHTYEEVLTHSSITKQTHIQLKILLIINSDMYIYTRTHIFIDIDMPDM